MADEDDKHCMARLREGDELALNDLMARWQEPLITFCLRYTGNLTDARELAQETFVKVYQSRDRFHPKEGAAFSTWIFRIATNLCRMRHRWKERHPEVLNVNRDSLCATEDLIEATEGNPRDDLERKTLAADLDAAIRELPPDQRTAFILQEMQGKTQSEIAAIQNCSVKAVERRLSRARTFLRDLLQKRWSPS